MKCYEVGWGILNENPQFYREFLDLQSFEFYLIKLISFDLIFLFDVLNYWAREDARDQRDHHNHHRCQGEDKTHSAGRAV